MHLKLTRASYRFQGIAGFGARSADHARIEITDSNDIPTGPNDTVSTTLAALVGRRRQALF
jgi:hypothetical protein